jgi:DNA processing protein
VVFVEGKVKSGGMITVTAALNQGRDVVRGAGLRGHSGGRRAAHTILREGARLITRAADLLEDLGLMPEGETVPESAPEPPQGDNPTQNAILRALAKESLGMDELRVSTGCGADALMTELGVLEIMGRVRRDSGNVFALVIQNPTK